MIKIHLNKSRYFSFDQDEKSGKYYLSFPVSNSRVDYTEYYEVTKEMVEGYPGNITEVEEFLHKCRLGQMFHLSLYKRAPDRGEPWWP